MREAIATERQILRDCYVRGLQKPFSRCFYCSTIIGWRELLPEFLKQNHYELIFRHKGEVKTVQRATIDHYIPLARGGKNVLSNIVPCCVKCNESKRAKTVEPQRRHSRNLVGDAFRKAKGWD